VVLNIHHLFISQILGDPDIKNFKIGLPIMLGASLFFLGKKSPKGNIIFEKRIFCHKYCFFLKKIQKIIN
jgi:hypothetical protein